MSVLAGRVKLFEFPFLSCNLSEFLLSLLQLILRIFEFLLRRIELSLHSIPFAMRIVELILRMLFQLS